MTNSRTWRSNFHHLTGHYLAAKPGEITLNGVVYSSDLLKPHEFALTVRAEVTPRNASVRQLLAFADAFQSEDD